MKKIVFAAVLTLSLAALAHAAALNIGDAWEKYNNGDYKDAARMFEALARDTAERDNATVGLGYSLMKLDDKQGAARAFAALVDRGYKLEETVPALVGLLLDAGEYDGALSAAGKLTGDAALALKERAVEAEATSILASGDPTLIGAFVSNRHVQLMECVAPGTFLSASADLCRLGDMEHGAAYIKDIRSACPYFEGAVRDDYDISGMKSAIARKRYADVAEAEKDGSAVEAMLGWLFFNSGRTALAEARFDDLLTGHPDNDEYALGLMLALKAQNKDESRQEDLAARYIGKRKDFATLLTNKLMAKGREHYESKQYADAEPLFRRVLSIDPSHSEARVLLAWTLYNQGKKDEANALFEGMFEEKPDPALARIMLSAYEDSGQRLSAFRFARRVAPQSPELAIDAGDYAYSAGCPALAAGMNPSEGTCYMGMNAPSVEVSPFYRSKTGSSGTSRLYDFGSELQYRHPMRDGKELSFSLIVHNISAGSAAPDVFAGNFYIGGVANTTTDATIYEPRVRYRREGGVVLTLEAGVAPIGGEASPTAVFLARIDGKAFSANIHREPVRDSLLSFSGMKDPYGTDVWGRVTRSGVQGLYRIAVLEKYSLAIEGGADIYQGENTPGNRSMNLSVGYGRSLSMKAADVYAGFYGAWLSFDKSTNHFTYGHGGYFSPGGMFAGGLSVDIKNKDCAKTAFSARGSFGYDTHKDKSAPQYYDSAAPSTAYAGESNSGFGGEIEARVLHLLTSRWAIGAGAAYLRPPGNPELNAAFTLRYYFSPRRSVTIGEHDLRVYR